MSIKVYFTFCFVSLFSIIGCKKSKSEIVKLSFIHKSTSLFDPNTPVIEEFFVVKNPPDTPRAQQILVNNYNLHTVSFPNSNDYYLSRCFYEETDDTPRTYIEKPYSDDIEAEEHVSDLFLCVYWEKFGNSILKKYYFYHYGKILFTEKRNILIKEGKNGHQIPRVP